MAKLAYAAFLIVFWISFPFITSLFFYDKCAQQLNAPTISEYKEPTGWDFFAGFTVYWKVLFNMMFMGIPCAPKWLSIITWSISIITGIVVYLFIRGD